MSMDGIAAAALAAFVRGLAFFVPAGAGFVRFGVGFRPRIMAV